MKNFETFCSEEEEKLCKMIDEITAQIAKDKAQNKVQDKADYIFNKLPHLIVQAICDYENFKNEP